MNNKDKTCETYCNGVPMVSSLSPGHTERGPYLHYCSFAPVLSAWCAPTVGDVWNYSRGQKTKWRDTLVKRHLKQSTQLNCSPTFFASCYSTLWPSNCTSVGEWWRKVIREKPFDSHNNEHEWVSLIKPIDRISSWKGGWNGWKRSEAWPLSHETSTISICPNNTPLVGER